MNINFVSYSNMAMASFRYRTWIPARILGTFGHQVNIVKADDQLHNGIYIFSKHFSPDEELALAKKLKDPNFMAANVPGVIADDAETNKIVFDVCDNHFKGEIGEYYRQMIDLADLVVAATPRMQEIISTETGRESVLIPDPFEFPERKPRFNWEQWECENLIWYGHPTNLRHLQRVWTKLGDHNLMVITSGVGLQVDGKEFPVIPWSNDAMLWGLAQSDLTIIPNEGMKSCKGANRMIESIRQGVFVVAEPSPAYMEFSEWMYIGDIEEGLKWVKENRESLQGRLEAAQRHVRKRYSPEGVGLQWQDTLSGLTARSGSNGVLQAEEKDLELVGQGKQPQT